MPQTTLEAVESETEIPKKIPILQNNHRKQLMVLYMFVRKKSFGQLLDILPKNFIFLKTFNSEFSYIEVQFTDRNSKLLEKEIKV